MVVDVNTIAFSPMGGIIGVDGSSTVTMTTLSVTQFGMSDSNILKHITNTNDNGRRECSNA